MPIAFVRFVATLQSNQRCRRSQIHAQIKFISFWTQFSRSKSFFFAIQNLPATAHRVNEEEQVYLAGACEWTGVGSWPGPAKSILHNCAKLMRFESLEQSRFVELHSN